MATRPKPTPAPVDRKYVTALARGLQILGQFENEVGMGNLEIARRTGLAPATVTRLTYTLTTLGYLRQLPDGRYCTGAGFLGLSASVQRNLGIGRTARPYMEALARELDCTVAMGTRDRNSMVFLEIARPSQGGITINTDIGSLLPIHNTAIGLAYLTNAPLAERARILELLREECAADWDQVRADIEAAHREYQRHGFVIWTGSWHRDVNAVGVALQVDWLPTLYSFICVGSSHKLTRRALRDTHGPRLVAMVATLAEAMQRERPVPLKQARRAR